MSATRTRSRPVPLAQVTPIATARCSARCCTTSARSARAATCRSARGSRPRRSSAWACRGPTRDLAPFMVAEHLLLPDTATRRDLTDENLILDVAARIGSPERLGALTLLAKADAVATGPVGMDPVAPDPGARARRAGCSACSTADDMGDGAGPATHRADRARAGPAGRRARRRGRTVRPAHAARLLPVGGPRTHRARITRRSHPTSGSTEVRATPRPGETAGHLRAAGRRRGPAGPAVVDRGRRRARGAFDPHRAGVHDRRRRRRRPVRGRGRVRARDRRGAVARVPWRAAQGRRGAASRWSTGWRRSGRGTRRPRSSAPDHGGRRQRASRTTQP